MVVACSGGKKEEGSLAVERLIHCRTNTSFNNFYFHHDQINRHEFP